MDKVPRSPGNSYSGLVLLLVGFAVLAAGCGKDFEPYAGMTDADLRYVIPDSARWGQGNPCEVDCGGPITAEQLRDPSWVVVENLRVIEGKAGEERTLQIEIDIGRVLSGNVAGSLLELRAWGQDIEWSLEALAAGHEIWAATDCPHIKDDYVCHFIAIDEQERFAGVGYGKGRFFTLPLARDAAASEASSGREFLEANLSN